MEEESGTMPFTEKANQVDVYATKAQVLDSCELIVGVADKLGLRLVSRCTALVFFHRFYEKQSFEDHDRFIMCLACIFLATKVEEDLRKLKEVINAGESVLKGGEIRHEEHEDIYKVLAERVLLGERVLLHTMAFDISIDHPHKVAYKYLQDLGNDGPELRQLVFNFLNDSLHTDACLLYTAEEIAAAGLMLAFFYVKEKIEANEQMTDAVSPSERFDPHQETIQAMNKFDEMYASNSNIFGSKIETLKQIVVKILEVFEPLAEESKANGNS